MIIEISEKKNIVLTINNNCYLKILKEKDITKEYVSWLNDEEVIKYTDIRFSKQNTINIKNFVKKKFSSNSDFLFGIYFDEIHIGNIKIGEIRWHHKKGEISFFIGNKSFWGQGIATLAVTKVLEFATIKLKLEKVTAGYYVINKASESVFKKCGFKVEGKKINDAVFDGKRIDVVIVGYNKEKINKL